MTEQQQILLACYAGLAMIEAGGFCIQRVALEVARLTHAPQEIVDQLLLPSWFPLLWVERLARWGLLIYIAVTWDWKWAVGVWLGFFLATAVMPIPRGFIVGRFRKRLQKRAAAAPDAAAVIESALWQLS